jgi:hypothetical protein
MQLKSLSLKLFLLLAFLIPASYSVAQIFPDNTQTEDISTDKKKKKKDTAEKEEDFFQFKLDKFNFSFFLRLIIDIVTMLVLIRFIYFPIYRKKDFFFTFFMFNIVIFFITYLLNKVELSTGAAFGLFAVFSMLRYRTEDISAKDMTYLFIVIALGIITAVNKGNLFEICIINAIVIVMVVALDGNLFLKNEIIKNIQYDNIELVKPENQAALLEDLKKRTGLNIHKVSIGKVDYLRDTATVKIYYYEEASKQ